MSKPSSPPPQTREIPFEIPYLVRMMINEAIERQQWIDDMLTLGITIPYYNPDDIVEPIIR